MINAESPIPPTTVTAIIQCRMQSTRLPGKAMLPLSGIPLIEHVIYRIKAIKEVTTIVLATCWGDENNVLIDIAKATGINHYVGSINNVLERFYNIYTIYGGEFIMRVTGDNPFTDPEFASQAAQLAIREKPDLCHIDNLPLGTGVGMIKGTALSIAYEKSHMPYHFEHVTPYLKEHPNIFHECSIPVDITNPFTHLRLTVDEPEDYQLAEQLYNELYHGNPFSLRDVIKYLIMNPHLASINSSIIQRPMTHSSNEET